MEQSINNRWDTIGCGYNLEATYFEDCWSKYFYCDPIVKYSSEFDDVQHRSTSSSVELFEVGRQSSAAGERSSVLQLPPSVYQHQQPYSSSGVFHPLICVDEKLASADARLEPLANSGGDGVSLDSSHHLYGNQEAAEPPQNCFLHVKLPTVGSTVDSEPSDQFPSEQQSQSSNLQIESNPLEKIYEELSTTSFGGTSSSISTAGFCQAAVV